VLGPGVVVAEGVAVVDSVVLGGSLVGADIDRVIVDEGADVVEETTGGDEPAVIA
jgi:ADP-glucose pyrophosphorylase